MMLERPKECDLLRGVWDSKNNQKVEMSHLFFPDDTLIFCEAKEEMVQNLGAVLLCFQAVPGLNINLNKSKIVRFGKGG